MPLDGVVRGRFCGKCHGKISVYAASEAGPNAQIVPDSTSRLAVARPLSAGSGFESRGAYSLLRSRRSRCTRRSSPAFPSRPANFWPVSASGEHRMDRSAAVARISALGAPSCGVISGSSAIAHGVTRRQLADLCAARVLERILPHVYRLTAVPPSEEQRLRAALLWAGLDAVAYGRSAGAWYGFEGVRARRAEIAVPVERHIRHHAIDVTRVHDLRPLMVSAPPRAADDESRGDVGAAGASARQRGVRDRV